MKTSQSILPALTTLTRHAAFLLWLVLAISLGSPRITAAVIDIGDTDDGDFIATTTTLTVIPSSAVPGTEITLTSKTPGVVKLTNFLSLSGNTLLVDADAAKQPRRFYGAKITGSRPEITNMVWIKPGTFTMGSPASEVDRFSNEGPQTQVTLSRGFWMNKYEVTQAEYQAVMGTNPSTFKVYLNRPVESVSWNDATNYCAKLTEKERQAGRLPEGYVYRLPTEAEWEYAARAGTTTRFSFGDDPGYTVLGNYAWYSANSANTTHPVGQKVANAWGLYDMYGNVWEWCLDWYGSYPGGSTIDPRGPTTGSFRVVRGGCWVNFAWNCRSAFRYDDSPVLRDNFIGFRPVLAPGQ